MKCCLILVMILGCNASIIRSAHDTRTQEKDLSNLDHKLNGHNPEYDHEAFLGREKAHEFDHLKPEDSKEKLGVIVEKIDSDNNGQVTEEEMTAWIKYIQRRYVTEDAKIQWKNYDKKPDDTMSWDEYQNRTFGSLTEEELLAPDQVLSYKEMRERDYRRFKLADVDYDGLLTFSEYTNFLHPEDAPHMNEVVVKEVIEDLDKNKDGVISEEEYIIDMWPQSGKEDEPDWVVTEREHFKKWRDLNNDGKLDYSEVQQWIMPEDYDHAIAESKHLIYEADGDKSGTLTKDEILEHYDIFVGSQATDFGQAFSYSHDEF